MIIEAYGYTFFITIEHISSSRHHFQRLDFNLQHFNLNLILTVTN